MDGTAADCCAERVRASLRLFDNHDPRLPYRELMLEGDPSAVTPVALPEGYRFVTYVPGDRDAWIAIERSARELESQAQGEEVWERFFGGRDEALRSRMFFAVSAAGEKVATATAWYDIRREDGPANTMLHWVAVRRDEQGRGLSKPVITRALRRMSEMGCRRAVIPTQTTTWLACKVYLDLGFRPIPKNAEHSRDGWEIVRALTDHPALAGFAEADISRFLRG